MKLVDNNYEAGATMVEYSVMVALIALVVIASVRILGANISSNLSASVAQIN
jgi:Flp pilus assembly pilin Flp